MGWVLAGVAWLLVGFATAVVADRRGHDRVLWAVLGLLFPVAALVALLLGFPRSHTVSGQVAGDVRAALHQSRTARTLAGSPGLDIAGISRVAGLPREQVGQELGALRVLGLVSRDRHEDTWTLTPRAAAALADDDEPGV